MSNLLLGFVIGFALGGLLILLIPEKILNMCWGCFIKLPVKECGHIRLHLRYENGPVCMECTKKSI